MAAVIFPKATFIGQTHVSVDKRLFYWTGAKWDYLGTLVTDRDIKVFKLKTDDSADYIPAHVESNRFTDLQSRTVTVVFGYPFAEFPKGISNLKVYRMVENEPGQWAVQDVIHFHLSPDWLTVSGFELEISIFEVLPGIIVEYYFTD